MTGAPTVGDALAAAGRRLARAGVAEPRFEARLLMGHVLGAGGAAVFGHPGRRLTPWQRRRWGALVARRCRREPMAHITGAREFWSLPFKTTADTLIPRPDSETVVDAALDWTGGRDRALEILDLGTGSGCLLLALLSGVRRARGTGVDISESALRVARANARCLGLGARARFVLDDWGRSLAGRFDVIVCNPPYVAEAELAGLQREVAAFEPRLALSGGSDGLDGYRAVLPAIGALLGPSGAAFVEIGAGQAPAVCRMARANGLRVVGVRKDLAGIPRCVATVPQGASKP